VSVEINQRYEVVRIDGDHDPLKEHPRNPRLGDEEVIEESIDVNGWYGAVVAQESSGYILAGNHRYRVAKQMGAREIPVIWKDVDDETAIKILLVDNKSADAGTYDEATLEALLDGLDTLDGTGYVLASAQETLESDDESPAEPAAENDGVLDPDEIPDDEYTPEYGVMVVCKSEAHQEDVYKYLMTHLGTQVDLRVVAV
jgi:ParB-like chromosome segregation protein Spo0J